MRGLPRSVAGPFLPLAATGDEDDLLFLVNTHALARPFHSSNLDSIDVGEGRQACIETRLGEGDSSEDAADVSLGSPLFPRSESGSGVASAHAGVT